jgi:hypothetical protein
MVRHLSPITRRFVATSGLGVLATLVAFTMAPRASADAYTEAIKGEAQRIDARPGAPKPGAAGSPAAPQDAEAAAFERELEQRYRGTYLFYKQLPVRNQEEVLQAHRGGASFENIRKMVMDRYQSTR